MVQHALRVVVYKTTVKGKHEIGVCERQDFRRNIPIPDVFETVFWRCLLLGGSIGPLLHKPPYPSMLNRVPRDGIIRSTSMHFGEMFLVEQLYVPSARTIAALASRQARFASLMAEDKTKQGTSYVDELFNLHHKIQAKMR